MDSLTFEVTSTSYSVKVTVEDMIKILDGDNEQTSTNDCLYAKLDAIDGCYGTDYDGHFGPYITFTIEKEHDHMGTRQEILLTIQQYLAGS